jgi:TonB family protein
VAAALVFGESMKSWILTALVATALTTMLASPAAADNDGDNKVRQVTTRFVTPAETAAVFPKAAFDQKISGHALLNCTADDAGREVDCRVVNEDPVGMGFGEAALVLVTKERVKTKDANGASIVGQRFNTGFSFLAPGDSNPDWVRKPTGADLAAAFPTRALQDGKAGKAIIKCNVTLEGFLERCTVLFESPEDYGFGAAALQLSAQFRMSPKIRGGKPVPGGEVTIPIIWGAPNARGPQAMFGSRRLMIDPPWTAAPSLAQVRAAWRPGPRVWNRARRPCVARSARKAA